MQVVQMKLELKPAIKSRRIHFYARTLKFFTITSDGECTLE
jgi:hypothetical protein